MKTKVLIVTVTEITVTMTFTVRVLDGGRVNNRANIDIASVIKAIPKIIFRTLKTLVFFSCLIASISGECQCGSEL